MRLCLPLHSEFCWAWALAQSKSCHPINTAKNYFITLSIKNTFEAEPSFLGLAPFLRLSVAGGDLLPIGQQLLAQTECNPDNANLWMNLSIVMQCLGQLEAGLAMQAQALTLQRIFYLEADNQPARLRLLMLMMPGDIAANTPLECLLEDSDIDIIFYYINHVESLALQLPDHDVLMVALGDSDENRELLVSLEQELRQLSKPVINAPQNIPATERAKASQLLQNVPGLNMPRTLRASRDHLRAIASGDGQLAELFSGLDFPLILRPVGSQAGRDLEKIESPEAVADYLCRVQSKDFFLSRFVDYRNEDELFRKFRIALIDGVPYACHMAVSSNWMVHYVNAGMYEDAEKRDEEARFMANFDSFVGRHRLALDEICRRTKLDYFCIDCAETSEGDLLIFEIDHVMVIHAMDPEDLFPYKQVYMRKVKNAFRDFLLRLATGWSGKTSEHVRTAF